MLVITLIVTSAERSLIQAELKQTKPFRNVEQEAFLAIARTADEMQSRATEMLKPYGISPTQFNVLRILRGAEPKGHKCGEIGDRMITRDPDITRLLDRLEKRGLISRCRETEDRRMVMARITPEGLKVLGRLDTPVVETHRKQMGHLGKERLRALAELLDAARSGIG